MSATGVPETLPLVAAYDDPDDPAELTLYPTESDCRETCWLTIDVEHAVALSDAR